MHLYETLQKAIIHLLRWFSQNVINNDFDMGNIGLDKKMIFYTCSIQGNIFILLALISQ